MEAIGFRKLIEQHGKLTACRAVISASIESEEQADAAIGLYAQRLLMARRYAAAGAVLWGESKFNIRPKCAQDVWRAISTESKVLVMGGGSVGKSYTGIAWNLLNWLADPQFTTVKLISTTGGHAKSNTFSTIKHLHETAVIKLSGVVRAEALQFVEQDERGCISIVRIREGEDNSGVLQGFHPLPRETPHHVFGKSSRVVAVLDEAEEIPNGAFTGIDNMMTSADSSGGHADAVKIMGFFNPKDISSKVAQLCEPPGGWSMFDVESGFNGSNTWKSKEGWRVVRIDPKETENVKQRKTIFAGFQTYEGFKGLESKNGGNSLSYFTFGRGAYPPEGVICTVFSQSSFVVGDFIFSGVTRNIGSADTALDGRDDCVLTNGRVGTAIGINKFVMGEGGIYQIKREMFKKPREAIQFDQQFVLPKGNVDSMSASLKRSAVSLSIPPESFEIDSTGNGAAVHGLLSADSYWSHKVRGLDFGGSATDMKVMAEDKKTAKEMYQGIDTECWFALARYAEAGVVAFSKQCAGEELQRQLIGRRYIQAAGKRSKVEDKGIFKKRLGRSPDNADSAIILVHCARMTGFKPPKQVEPVKKKVRIITDDPNWLD